MSTTVDEDTGPFARQAREAARAKRRQFLLLTGGASLSVMGAAYVGAGVSHFTNPLFFLEIVPPHLPWKLPIVYVSGVAEIVLGAASRGELSALSAPDGGPPSLRFASKRVLIPITNEVFLLGGFVFKLFARDIYNAAHLGGVIFRPHYPQVMSELAVVKLGDLTFITAPGEVFSELLTGGYPGRTSAQEPTIGDLEELRVGRACGPDGLPIEGGSEPCVVRPTQENPPRWEEAPEGPYVYDLTGERPFFIGLGMDFLGYIVPEYDFQTGAVAGSHYEETNSASGEMTTLWREGIRELLELLP